MRDNDFIHQRTLLEDTILLNTMGYFKALRRGARAIKCEGGKLQVLMYEYPWKGHYIQSHLNMVFLSKDSSIRIESIEPRKDEDLVMVDIQFNYPIYRTGNEIEQLIESSKD